MYTHVLQVVTTYYYKYQMYESTTAHCVVGLPIIDITTISRGVVIIFQEKKKCNP
jgi:hypothetical protein